MDHAPRKISSVCNLFLRRGGVTHCIVTGRRQYSADLVKGKLESTFILRLGHEKYLLTTQFV